MAGDFEPVLRVFSDRVEYEPSPGVVELFLEGPTTSNAKARFRTIESWFENGSLENLVQAIRDSPADADIEDATAKTRIDLLVNSVTSERGRALAALMVMQMAIKTACPTQSIRLHKGGRGHGGERFSWREGISMRSLDRNFVTPFLRKHDLIKLNSDGFMMTRSLAENYPYTALYKAALRGAREAWLSLTETLEHSSHESEGMLKYMLSALLNRSDVFQRLADSTIAKCEAWLAHSPPSLPEATEWIARVVRSSEYSARIFEISIHSLLQAVDDTGRLPFPLKPLSQMRSANKKHKNIGDIEILHRSDGTAIVEAWDAKFGKPYLRDELEELDDKLADHPETQIAGFITSDNPNLTTDIEKRRIELEETHGVSVQIMRLEEWAAEIPARFDVPERPLAAQWIRCLIESIAQRRRPIAPIDEPCDSWLHEIRKTLPALE